jgi:hypothetical protein
LGVKPILSKWYLDNMIDSWEDITDYILKYHEWDWQLQQSIVRSDIIKNANNLLNKIIC